jgi:signal transduction histidine kinase
VPDALYRRTMTAPAASAPRPIGPARATVGGGRGWDAVTAAAAGVLQIGGTALAGIHQDASFTALSFVLLAAGPIALAFRRRAPLTVLAVNFAAAFAYWLTPSPRGPVFVGLLVALVHASGTAGHRVAGWVTLALGFLAFGFAGAALGFDEWPTWVAIAGIAGWLLLIAGAIEVHRFWRERTAAAQRSREEETRRQASEERLRIARELHDVLAHNISLINVQAGVALHLLDSQPEQAEPALRAIKAASKEALGELRSVLDVLRSPDDAAPRDPTVGLDHLDELVDRTRAAGLDVAVRVIGDRRALPAGVDLAAYRIVQEALTNVVRHVGPTRVVIELRYLTDALAIVLEDDGPSRSSASSAAAALVAVPSGPPGNGIAGMRERAATLGGTLDAGPRPSGGFRVAARLPLDDRVPSSNPGPDPRPGSPSVDRGTPSPIVPISGARP